MTNRPEIDCPDNCDNGTVEYSDGSYYYSMSAEQYYPTEVLGPCERCEGRGTIWPEELTAEEHDQHPGITSGAMWAVA